jgi:hypothetical protein
MEISGEYGGQWTLLTGHGHVLVEIARNPTVRIRDISAIVGLAERTRSSAPRMPPPSSRSRAGSSR